MNLTKGLKMKLFDYDGEELTFLTKPIEEQLAKANKDLANARDLISDYDSAIVLLKKYIADNGLPSIWEPTLVKPVGEMTKEEIIERNKKVSAKPMAVSAEAVSHPEFDEMHVMYSDRISTGDSCAVAKLAAMIVQSEIDRISKP